MSTDQPTYVVLSESGIQEKKRVAWISVIWAVALTVTKIVVGILTNSIGIISEALHSGLDLIAAGITFFAVNTSGKPADREHTYGHGKIEAFSAFIETIILLITCIWIVIEAVKRITHPGIEIEVNFWSYGVMAFSIIVNLNRTIMLRRAAKKYNSQALAADALHFSADILSSVVVIIGLGVTQLGFPLADPIAAVFVALVILLACIDLGKKTIDVLLDRASNEAFCMVEAAVHETTGIHEPVRLRVREQGDRVFVDARVSVDRNLTFEQSHAITDSLERNILLAIPNADIMIHAEPIPLPEEDFIRRVRTLGLSLPGIEDVHNIQVKSVDEGFIVDLHVGFRPSTPFVDADRQSLALKELVLGDIPAIREITVHLEPIRDPAIGQEVSEQYPHLLEQIRTHRFEQQDSILDLEVLKLIRANNELHLVLHCRLERTLTLEQAHDVTSRMEREVLGAHPELRQVIIQAEPA